MLQKYQMSNNNQKLQFQTVIAVVEKGDQKEAVDKIKFKNKYLLQMIYLFNYPLKENLTKDQSLNFSENLLIRYKKSMNSLKKESKNQVL